VALAAASLAALALGGAAPATAPGSNHLQFAERVIAAPCAAQKKRLAKAKKAAAVARRTFFRKDRRLRDRRRFLQKQTTTLKKLDRLRF
jgi:hypothetical protein